MTLHNVAIKPARRCHRPLEIDQISDFQIFKVASEDSFSQQIEPYREGSLRNNRQANAVIGQAIADLQFRSEWRSDLKAVSVWSGFSYCCDLANRFDNSGEHFRKYPT
jgi:hypothetical protein